jgi:hypothetical protein
MADALAPQFRPRFLMTPQEDFAYQHHLANFNRGGVKNDDGSLSTYRSIGVNIEGREYVLPTVWDNQIISNDEAIKRAREVGLDNFPSYENPEEAEARYNMIHELMERDLMSGRR